MENYKDWKECGQGTFGIVYRATQKSSGRTVAIKQLKEEMVFGREEGFKYFALREIMLMHELKHEHVVEMLEKLLDDFTKERNDAMRREMNSQHANELAVAIF